MRDHCRWRLGGPRARSSRSGCRSSRRRAPTSRASGSQLAEGERFRGFWRGEGVDASGQFGERPVYLCATRRREPVFLRGGLVILDAEWRKAHPQPRATSIYIARGTGRTRGRRAAGSYRFVVRTKEAPKAELPSSGPGICRRTTEPCDDPRRRRATDESWPSAGARASASAWPSPGRSGSSARRRSRRVVEGGEAVPEPRASGRLLRRAMPHSQPAHPVVASNLVGLELDGDEEELRAKYEIPAFPETVRVVPARCPRLPPTAGRTRADEDGDL